MLPLKTTTAPRGTDTVVPSLSVSVDPSCSARRTLTGYGRLPSCIFTLSKTLCFLKSEWND